MIRKLDWRLVLTEKAMVLIKSQLLSMEYNSETKEYNFKRRELTKQKAIGSSNSVRSSPIIKNFHSRAEMKLLPGSRMPDGDSCQQWDFICCCEVLNKAHKKSEDPQSVRNKKTIQGVLSIYQTRVFIVRTEIRTRITTRIRVLPSQERPQSQRAEETKRQKTPPLQSRTQSISSIDSRVFHSCYSNTPKQRFREEAKEREKSQPRQQEQPATMINISMVNRINVTPIATCCVLQTCVHHSQCTVIINSKPPSPTTEPSNSFPSTQKTSPPEPRKTRMIDFYPTEPGYEFILGTVGQMII